MLSWSWHECVRLSFNFLILFNLKAHLPDTKNAFKVLGSVYINKSESNKIFTDQYILLQLILFFTGMCCSYLTLFCLYDKLSSTAVSMAEDCISLTGVSIRFCLTRWSCLASIADIPKKVIQNLTQSWCFFYLKAHLPIFFFNLK